MACSKTSEVILRCSVAGWSMTRTRVLVHVLCWFCGRFKSCCCVEGGCVYLGAAGVLVLPSASTSFGGMLGLWLAAPSGKYHCPLWVKFSHSATVKSWRNLGLSLTSWFQGNCSCRQFFAPVFSGLAWSLPEAGTRVSVIDLSLPKPLKLYVTG